MTIYRGQFTYSASSTAFTPPATPTDVFTITGNATTNVYVLKVTLSTTQTTEGTNAWFLAKRSAADTGGTATQPAVVPFNSANSTASSVVNQYSANPTTGALVGYVWNGWVFSPTVTTATTSGNQTVIDFEDMFGQPLTLLSTSEVLALNFKGAALPAGLSVLVNVVWTEGSKT